MIRRGIAAVILGPALLMGSLAWSGFLALRTVFEPDRSREIAEELLDNDQVREQLTSNVAAAIRTAIPDSAAFPTESLNDVAAQVLEDPVVEELIIDAFTQSHAAFLGDGDAPNELDLGPAAASARQTLVQTLPSLDATLPEAPDLQVELPTDRIPNASPVRSFLQKAVPVLAVVAIGGVILAFFATSDRPSVLRKAGLWAAGTTAVYLLIGLGLPWLLRQAAPAQWEVAAALLAAMLRSTIMPSIVLALCGAGLLLAALAWPTGGRPRPRREPPPEPEYAPQPLPQPAPQPQRQPRPQRVPESASARIQAVADRVPVSTSHPTGPRIPRKPLAEPQPATGSLEPNVVSPPPSPAPQATAPRPTPTPPMASVPGPAPVPAPEPTPPPRAHLPTREQGIGPARFATRDDLAADGHTRDHEPSTASQDLTSADSEEQVESPKWLPPTWVEGHGWVLDPDDTKPPPPNSRWVEGVGYVVPGPPPNT